ncbi:MlaA family lipoprotein [Azohydromonas lata]|uniref:VacJ family lipoprotein n=1 Tax=Azohydromonas lata TaxID=45677 RepID=A0ABU5I8K2_9BURK|nr:VacJ family lipoprotein [Azohydromonas lata]MDZ5455431.1 VacJ family lipoprotein [Azohydromonas lata]
MKKNMTLLLAAALLCAGGAAQAQAQQAASSPVDPLEGFNRSIFNFNEGLDRTVLKPVATAYRDVVPSPVRTGVSNFMGNFSDAWSAINQFLQGKGEAGISMTFRVLVNSTFGLAGLVDWATPMGLERQSEDFGQTLGRWGLGSGPYIVLPLLGPSSLRDTAGLTLDLQTTPSSVLFSSTSDRVMATSLQVINRRSELLGATDVVDQIALDKYQFIRDGYLARRRSQVYDGNPPEQPDEQDDDTGTGDAGTQPAPATLNPAAPPPATPAPAPASAQ